MATVQGTTVGGGLGFRYKQNNRQNNWKDTQVVSKQKSNVSPASKQRIKDESLLADVRDLWDTLTTEEKQWWKECGWWTDMEVYNFFTQDTCYRLKNDIAGIKVPTKDYQYKVAHLHLPDNGSLVKLMQSGSATPRYMFELYTHYKSQMVEEDSDEWLAEFEIRGWYMDGAIKKPFAVFVPLDVVADWGRTWDVDWLPDEMLPTWEFTLTIKGFSGDLWFDNTYATDFYDMMSNDMYCNRVEKSWTKIIFPTGATMQSIYIP